MRIANPTLDTMINDEQFIKVLNKGFIRVVDYMGGDDSIVQSARVSYGRGTKKALDDIGLIRYLMRNSHSTPFESAELKLHIKLPIFVAKQVIRHRTASINEYSARYSEVDSDFYNPAPARIQKQSALNKQGGEGEIVENSDQISDEFQKQQENAYNLYQKALKNEVSREVARIILPQGMYTELYIKFSAWNWGHFCHLRSGSHSQQEIRAYSDIILHTIIKAWMPVFYQALLDYRINARTLSAQALEIIKRRLQGDNSITQKSSRLGVREWNELLAIFPINET